MVAKEWLEAPFGDGGEDEVGASSHAGAAALVIEQGHLAKVVPGPELVVPAIGGRDVGLALEDDQEPDAPVSSDHDLRTLRMPDLAHLLGHFLDLGRGEAFEDADWLEVHPADSTSSGAFGKYARQSIGPFPPSALRALTPALGGPALRILPRFARGPQWWALLLAPPLPWRRRSGPRLGELIPRCTTSGRLAIASARRPRAPAAAPSCAGTDGWRAHGHVWRSRRCGPA